MARDLSDYIEMPQPRRFLVTSSGHSGSIWLAGSLNLHDEVLTTVGLGHPLQCFSRYAMNKDLGYMIAHATPELLAFGMHEPTGYLPTLPAGLEYSTERDLWRLPWWIFDELALIPTPRPVAAVGNVHALVLAHIGQARQQDPGLLADGSVAMVELIRHPVPRTESAIRATEWLHLGDFEPRLTQCIDAHAAEFLALERRHGIDFTEPRARAALIVFRASLQNDYWAKEVRDYPDVSRVLMEQLQSNREEFATTFHTLTGLVADSAYLDRVFAPENLGSGRQSTSAVVQPPGPREQYELWSSFEREEFARAGERLELQACYRPFGYDFSFVAAPTGVAEHYCIA